MLALILQIVIMLGFAYLVFAFGPKFIFDKIRITKWIPLALAVVVIAAQFFLRTQLSVNLQLLMTLLGVFFFIWFMHINMTGGPKVKKEKDIVIRPKAKPNRAKHINNNK